MGSGFIYLKGVIPELGTGVYNTKGLFFFDRKNPSKILI